jgi:hypothetical protein
MGDSFAREVGEGTGIGIGSECPLAIIEEILAIWASSGAWIGSRSHLRGCFRYFSDSGTYVGHSAVR